MEEVLVCIVVPDVYKRQAVERALDVLEYFASETTERTLKDIGSCLLYTSMEELKRKLHEACTAFDVSDASGFREDFMENVAVCDENSLEEYLENGELSEETIAQLVKSRKVFPCYFGSALKVQGVQEFLDGIGRYTCSTSEDAVKEDGAFGARVYKISRDSQGNRLTHLKIISGCLKVKDTLYGHGGWEEKVNQIRIYSGERFETVQTAKTGMIDVYKRQDISIAASIRMSFGTSFRMS